jgi:hypothetical protein
MANSVYDYSSTSALANGTTAGDAVAENATAPSAVNNAIRGHKYYHKLWLDDQAGVNQTVGGTANAITLTTSQGFTAYGTADGQIKNGTEIAFKNTVGPNTAATTINVNAIGIKKIRGQGDVALAGGEMVDDGIFRLRYDTAADTAAGAWILLNPAVTATSIPDASTTVKGIVKLAFGGAYNLGLAASVGSSALTIAIKGVDGNDPSASNPVVIPLRNVTAATGTPSYLTLTAATSLVINSTATMAFSNAVAGRIWIVLFNDGGTARVGAINCWNGADIYPLGAKGIASSTTVGTGADSAHVFYTDAGVSSKAYAVLGYAEWSAGLTAAGTWDIVPTRLQLLDSDTPLPGTVVQQTRTQTGAVATGTTTMPFDDTIPQSGEGIELMTAPAITATSAANVRRSEITANLGHSVNSALLGVALFKDSEADALGVSMAFNFGTNGAGPATTFSHHAKFGSTSAQTMKCRAGSASAGTLTFNGIAGGRLFGGVMASSITVSEIMA